MQLFEDVNKRYHASIDGKSPPWAASSQEEGLRYQIVDAVNQVKNG